MLKARPVTNDTSFFAFCVLKITRHFRLVSRIQPHPVNKEGLVDFAPSTRSENNQLLVILLTTSYVQSPLVKMNGEEGGTFHTCNVEAFMANRRHLFGNTTTVRRPLTIFSNFSDRADSTGPSLVYTVLPTNLFWFFSIL